MHTWTKLIKHSISIKAIKKNKPQGKNNITIKTYSAGKGNGCIVQIKDSGTGIPEKNLNNIFEPFWTTDKREGTGLGLSLCKKIVELYNGSITAENNKDTGASFKFFLPGGEF